MHEDEDIADYETGARKYPLRPQAEDGEFDQKAAENKPRLPFGLAEPAGEPVEATNRSEGVQPVAPARLERAERGSARGRGTSGAAAHLGSSDVPRTRAPDPNSGDRNG